MPGVIDLCVVELRSLQALVDMAVTGLLLLLLLLWIFFTPSCFLTNTFSKDDSCPGEDLVEFSSDLRALATIWLSPGVLGLLGLAHGTLAVIKVVLEELGDIADLGSLA